MQTYHMYVTQQHVDQASNKKKDVNKPLVYVLVVPGRQLKLQYLF